LALIKSISGIRGTIGGKAGDNLTPQDIVECTAAFGYYLLQNGATPKVVIGRDGRISGPMVARLVANTLVGLGIDVIDLGHSTTPTVEVAVTAEGAGAGIVISASHNPRHWNALKFLNEQGEFISPDAGEALLKLIDQGAIEYAGVDQLGRYRKREGHLAKHIDRILALPLVDKAAVAARHLKVVVDPVNSTGALALPPLLGKMGVQTILINAEVNGEFAHNPEPLPANLVDLAAKVVEEKADLGIAVDPDVDRLAFICENGELFGEEYTLVAVADYVLQQTPGDTVSNLSSTRALRDVTRKHGGAYHASAVGEVNVVRKMKAVDAVIGGEGNGGVIVPELHYGRDALVGVALFLTHLARSGKKASELKAQYPQYYMVKDRIDLTPEIDLDHVLMQLRERYANEELNLIDGVKIDLPDSWVHLRKSNTEPIIRVYAEGKSPEAASNLAARIKKEVKEMIAS
jgi:phosphomannomutase